MVPPPPGDPSGPTDRRVARSRAALMRAAVALVSERGTTAVSISTIAETAGVSRQLVYQHFRDRDTLLLHAALDLVRSEVLPIMAGEWPEVLDRERFLGCVRHFADHRSFYRAMFTGGTAMALHRAIVDLLSPYSADAIRRTYGEDLSPQTLADLGSFITGGIGTLILEWLIEGPEDHDPEDLYERLLHSMSALRAERARH